jgi:hypothetical protein
MIRKNYNNNNVILSSVTLYYFTNKYGTHKKLWEMNGEGEGYER